MRTKKPRVTGRAFRIPATNHERHFEQPPKAVPTGLSMIRPHSDEHWGSSSTTKTSMLADALCKAGVLAIEAMDFHEACSKSPFIGQPES